MLCYLFSLDGYFAIDAELIPRCCRVDSEMIDRAFIAVAHFWQTRWTLLCLYSYHLSRLLGWQTDGLDTI